MPRRRRRGYWKRGGERGTFAQDLLYVLCKNHQTGTADKSCIPSHDYECLHLQKKKKKEEKETCPERGRRNLEIRDTTKFFGNFFGKNRTKSLEEFSRDFERRVLEVYTRNPGFQIVQDSPRMFYQNTLWYRRRFKGDGTMFTECRGADRRMEGRVYRGMPLVGLSCKPFPRAKPAPPRLLYIPFHSHL